MTGQGSPKLGPRPALRRSFARPLGAPSAAAVWLCAALLACPSATAADLDIRLRIAWGGGESSAWQGSIRLSAGEIADVVPLGLEADDPGSMQIASGTSVRIYPRTMRSYDGCDLRIKAPGDARLLIDIAPAGAAPGVPLEVALADVLKGVAEFPLDERENRLLIQRSPGDALRVTLPRDHLVFSPGEKLELDVAANPADVAAATTYLLAASLLTARQDQQLWNEDVELKTDAEGRSTPAALAIPLPPAEGVYDVRLALYPKRLTTTFVRGKPLFSRKVQVVVVAPVKTLNRDAAPWTSVLDFDPSSPKWWERMTRLPTSLRLPTLPAQPVGSGTPRARQHLGRAWVELAPAAWQAYPLTVTSPGLPHVLEIEYPSDLEQTLGISIVEPNAAGQVGPIGLDSGFDVPAPSAGHEPSVKRQRLIFWPSTRAPLVLLVNRRDDRAAVFGKINLTAGPGELPPLAVATSKVPARTLAAYYDKPLLAENFSAGDAVDPATGRCLDDWLTFYDAGRRMVETLQHTGYNAAVITVACDGGAIYPSSILQPTPKYDTGLFFESGQDPVRKDVLELLFRLCDRAGIQLVPAVQFSAPLPRLEEQRLAGGDRAAGLEPLGPDGRTWLERNGARRGMGVYYNALDGRVQKAMIEVVAELTDRYGHHPAFAGISVQLGPESYAMLPDETCSYDDATLAAFAEQAAVELPATSRTNLVARAEFLHEEGEEAWLTWRAQRIATLYGQMRETIVRRRGSARLYLATGELLASRQVRLALQPALPARSDPRLVLRLMGLDAEKLASTGAILPRPQRIVPQPVTTHDFQQHWNQARQLDALLPQTTRAAAMHFLEPAPLRLPDFDAVSPFGPEKTHTWLVSQIPPAGAAYRRRFAESLHRADATAILDGGWLLPLGQEAELAPWAKVFRRLPAEAFATVDPAAGDKQPASEVVVRRLQRGGKTYFYAVNAAPWPVELAIELDSSQPLQLLPYADERPAELERAGERSTWTAHLEPFDLVGGEIDTEEVTFHGYRVTPPAGAADLLRDQIRTVRLRANSLRSPVASQVLNNPSFEAPAEPETVPGWVHARGPGIQVQIDRGQGYRSANSLHVISQPAGAGAAPVVWLRSDSFPAPTTGRLSMIAWVRVADAAHQPRLRLAIEGKLDGRTYYRRANVGASEDGLPTKPLTTSWAPYRFPLADLPQAGLTDLRIGFDLMGEGEVWIDDVQVFDLWFEEHERDELLKSIATADVQASGGQLMESQQFLDSYWPSFLRRHIQLPDPRPPAGQANEASPSPAAGGNGPDFQTRRSAGPSSTGAAVPSSAAAAPPRKPQTMTEQLKSWLPKSLRWR